jgi:hypothetical protein
MNFNNLSKCKIVGFLFLYEITMLFVGLFIINKSKTPICLDHFCDYDSMQILSGLGIIADLFSSFLLIFPLCWYWLSIEIRKNNIVLCFGIILILCQIVIYSWGLYFYIITDLECQKCINKTSDIFNIIIFRTIMFIICGLIICLILIFILLKYVLLKCVKDNDGILSYNTLENNVL